MEWNEWNEWNPLEENLNLDSRDRLGRLALFPDQHLDVPIRGGVFELYYNFTEHGQHKPDIQKFKRKRVERMSGQIRDERFHQIFNPLVQY